MSMKYVISMCDSIFVFQASVFPAQVSVDSDFGISMRSAL